MIDIKNENAMQAYGEQLGRLVEGSQLIELVGDVGAGKTTFVRGLARGMGIDETIQSPSFTINRVYENTAGLRLVHYDFYRLNDPGIMANEIIEEINDDTTVVVIEWADAVSEVLPQDRLTIKIESPDEFSRNLHLKAGGPRSQALMETMK